jgi:hypothetical protein
MVEIIVEKIKMPNIDDRKFYKKVIDLGKLQVNDKDKFPSVVYEGNYEMASLICLNLNKKFYRDNPV